MSKAVVKYENRGHKVDEVMIIKCEYNREFTVYLQKNIHKNVKSYNGDGSWTFTGGATINQMIFEKVIAIFGIEEEVAISAKEISPAPAPQTTETKKEEVKKEIVAIVTEKRAVQEKIELQVANQKRDAKEERKLNTKKALSGEVVAINLRGVSTKTALKKAFKTMFYGIKTDFVDLLDLLGYSFETLYFQGKEISIDNIGGCECFRYHVGYQRAY